MDRDVDLRAPNSTAQGLKEGALVDLRPSLCAVIKPDGERFEVWQGGEARPYKAPYLMLGDGYGMCFHITSLLTVFLLEVVVGYSTVGNWRFGSRELVVDLWFCI